MIRPLSPELAEKARAELNEVPEKLEENIQYLKEWLLKQPHLRARTDDQWLVAFLRGCKFRMDQTKAKLDLYFSLRSTAPYLYSIRYPEQKFMDLLNRAPIIILPKTKNPADPRVVLYRIGQYDPNKYSLLDAMAVYRIQEQISFMEDDNFVVAGTVNVVDLGGTRFGHYTQTSLKHLSNLIHANQNAAPIRIKALHFLNTGPFFETFFNVCKIFLNEKNKNRLFMHNKNIDAFHEHVAKEILPEEYGGTGDSIQECIDYWKQKIGKYNSFLEEDLQYGSDESKRLNKS